MKHFIDNNGNLFGFEKDGSQDFLIKEDMRELTDEEFKELTAPKKEEKLSKLKYDFELKYNELVEFNGNLFTGGFDSASRLFSKIQYAKLVNLDNITFTSNDDKYIDLLISEAEELYKVLSLDFENKRLDYKEQKRLIESLG